MDSKTYWRQREEEALRKYKKSEAEYDKEIERIYRDMLDGCEREINAFYGKYAKAEGISIAEAKKRVKTADIKEFERKAVRYVRDASLDRKANGGKTNKTGYYFSPKANEEMRLYNTMMKINRLEMLKANIGLELIKGHDELDKFMGDILKGRTEEELKRQAGILGKTIRNNAQLAHTIPNASFHNATFSDRIWQYQDLMREDLSKILSRGLIQGKNPRAIAKELQKYWYGNDPKTGGGAVYCMERLMRTELARVQTEAQKQSFEKNGFTEYEFIANSDCCGICKALDGKHFKVSKMMPGENAAPIHPHCRCSVAAYEDSKEYEEWLSFLEKGGTTAEYEALKAKSSKGTFNSLKLSGIDKDYAPQVEDTFNTLMSDYPVQGLNVKTNNSKDEFGNFKGGIKGITKNGEQYAVLENAIEISGYLHKNKATSTESHIDSYNEKLSPLANAKNVHLATIPHEYGHAVDSAYVLAKDANLRAFADKYKTPQKVSVEDIEKINDFNLALSKSDKRLSKEIFDELQQEYGLNYMGTVMKVSQEYGVYAGSSISEFLAEGVSNMYTLDEADKTDFMKSFEKIFDRKYKEVLGNGKNE